MKPVTPEMWKSLPLPNEREELHFTASYSRQDMDAIMMGFCPKEMEDKWFIFFQDNFLYFHRSWTGHCIFVLQFIFTPSGVSVGESWVNRNPEQYRSNSISTDKNILQSLIDFLIRRKN